LTLFNSRWQRRESAITVIVVPIGRDVVWTRQPIQWRRGRILNRRNCDNPIAQKHGRAEGIVINLVVGRDERIFLCGRCRLHNRSRTVPVVSAGIHIVAAGHPVEGFGNGKLFTVRDGLGNANANLNGRCCVVVNRLVGGDKSFLCHVFTPHIL